MPNFALKDAFNRCKNGLNWFFCAIRKYLKWGLLIALIGIVASIISIPGDLLNFLKIIGPDVTVSPADISLTLDSYRNHHSFVVHNRKEETVYAVWLQIAFESENRLEDKVCLDWDIVSSDRRKFVLPHATQSTPDAVLMLGKSAEGDSALFLVIRKINPIQSVQFELMTNLLPCDHHIPLSSKYTFKILSVSDTQDRYQTKGKHIQMFFDKMPKGLKMVTSSKNFLRFLEDKNSDSSH
jgi:hypothetical protein